MVKTNDCMKNQVSGYYKIEPILETKGNPINKGQNQKEEAKPSKKENKAQMTKLERKQNYKELKRTLNQE